SSHLSGGDGVLFVSGVATDFSGNPGYATVNIQNPAAMALIAGSTGAGLFGLAADGGKLAIAPNRVAGSSITVVDISDPTKTGSIVTTLPIPARALSAAVAGGLGVEVDGSSLTVIKFAQQDTFKVAPTGSITL